MKQTEYRNRKGKVGLLRLLSVFLTPCLVANLVPSQSIAYARDEVQEALTTETPVTGEEPDQELPCHTSRRFAHHFPGNSCATPPATCFCSEMCELLHNYVASANKHPMESNKIVVRVICVS